MDADYDESTYNNDGEEYYEEETATVATDGQPLRYIRNAYK